jgi:hypothetical protein
MFEYVCLRACMVLYIGVEAEMGGDSEGAISRAATCLSPLPPAPTPRAVELGPADGASRACYLTIIDEHQDYLSTLLSQASCALHELELSPHELAPCSLSHRHVQHSFHLYTSPRPSPPRVLPACLDSRVVKRPNNWSTQPPA